MKVGHYENAGTDLKVWGHVQTSEVLCHPQSKVLANHLFLAHIDGMKALMALATGEGLEVPGSCRQGTGMFSLGEKASTDVTMPLYHIHQSM